MTNCFEHAANLPVAPLGNGNPVPAIGAFSTALFNRTELCNAIVQSDTIQQHLLLILAQ
jgi:hypothetical protein